MSVSTVVTMGYGSFGSVNLLPMMGYSAGEPEPEPVDAATTNIGAPPGGGGRPQRYRTRTFWPTDDDVPRERVKDEKPKRRVRKARRTVHLTLPLTFTLHVVAGVRVYVPFAITEFAGFTIRPATDYNLSGQAIDERFRRERRRREDELLLAGRLGEK